MKKSLKMFNSPDYNYIFNTENGSFARWGKTYENDPDFSPYGPEILDIEVSTICNQGCKFCYKSNTAKGENMSLETFKKIFALMPKTLTQIAFGIGNIDANLDLWAIMDHTRENGIIPNITINGSRMENYMYLKLAQKCGAVSVSNYGKDQCYDTVEMLTEGREWSLRPTLKQINIHQLLCEETYEDCMDLMKDTKVDPRLSSLNAIVFLIMKPKGKRNKYHQLRSKSKYQALIDYAMKNNVAIGFDSCSAPAFIRAVEKQPNAAELIQLAEPCESTCFSLYVDVNGKTVPCSFCEEEPGIEPVDLLQVTDFQKEVWMTPSTVSFRNKLLAQKRSCPVFDLEMDEK